MPPKKIGIIGAGRLGMAIAKLADAAGYTVDITNSGDSNILQLTLDVLLPQAHVKPIEQLAADNTLLILAIPFGHYTQLTPHLFKDKILIDATNYWEPTEGLIPEFKSSNLTSSEFLQRYFKDAKIVKTLNHIAYSELWPDSALNTDSSRRAIAIAADDENARVAVSNFIEAIGFDTVNYGNLSNSGWYQPDTLLFNARYDKKKMQKIRDEQIGLLST
jgi:8-hydroxy-5-deazaflavin:NADPH oxidoreductase